MSKISKELNNGIVSEIRESSSSLKLKEHGKRRRSTEEEVIEYNDDFYEDVDDDINSDLSINPASVSETIAFWLLGLTCLFSYNVVVSAGHDLTTSKFNVHLHKFIKNNPHHHSNYFLRDCNEQSTGTFCLINIVPELIAQFIATFCPFYCLQFRMILVIFIMTSGILICATSKSAFGLYCGVGIVSVSTGIVVNTLISYISLFDNKHLIITLSIGFGSAGLGASLWYVVLVALGISSAGIFYTLLAVPFIMSVAFWGILNRPDFWCLNREISERQASSFSLTNIHKKKGCLDYLHHIKTNLYLNILYIPNLYPFIITTFMVYFFEYYINLCLHELIIFHKFSLTRSQQFQWYSVTYNVAVFLVKSSLYFVSVKTLWFLPVLQGMNAAFLTLSAIYYLIPHFSIVLCFVFWEGLMGGFTFITIFYVLYSKVNPERRKFSLAFIAIAQCCGVTLAALISGPAHHFICNLPANLSVWNLP